MGCYLVKIVREDGSFAVMRGIFSSSCMAIVMGMEMFDDAKVVSSERELTHGF